MADLFMRKDVLGITPLDMKNMNDNFKYIWLKVFGNLNTADLMDRAVTGDKIAYETVKADNIAVDTLYVGTGGIRIDSTASITWEQVDTTNAPTLIQNIDVNEQRAVFDALTDMAMCAVFLCKMVICISTLTTLQQGL
jgi:hypothetical protein